MRRPRHLPAAAAALLLPLAIAVPGCRQAPADGTRQGGERMTPLPIEAPLRLAAGEAVAGDPSMPLPHRYEVAVPAGHYLRVAARQRGWDVLLRLAPPDGTPPLDFDSPSGDEGEEVAHAVAGSAGVYLVEVDGEDPPAEGGYEIEVTDLRPASDEDRLRAEAETLVARADMRRRAAEAGRREAFAAALAAVERLGDEARLPYVLDRLGHEQAADGLEREAAASYRRGLDIAIRLGDEEAQAKAHNRLGRLAREGGRLEEALEHQAQALELFERLGEKRLAAETLVAYGQSLDWSGRPREALAALHRALDLWRGLGSRAGEADVQVVLGDVHLALEQLDLAADAFEVAARLARELGDERKEAMAERGLAARLGRGGEPAAAVPHLRRALELARALDDEQLQAVVLGDLGTAELQRGEVEAARRALAESQAIAERLGDRRTEAFSLHKLARCAYEGGDFRASERLHARAAERFAELGDPVTAAGARYGQARALRRLGDLDAALAALAPSLATAEEVRRATGGHELQTSFAAAKGHYRELLVDLLMELDARRPDEGHALAALAAADDGRSRVLLDLMRESGAASAAVPAALSTELADLDARLEGLRRLRRWLGEEGGGGDQALAEVERAQRSLLVRLDRARAEARHAPPSAAAGAAAPPTPEPWSRERLAALLDEQTLVLVYSLGEERSFLWVLWHGGWRSAPLPPRGEIEALAQRAADGLTRLGAAGREEAEGAVLDLARAVLAPAGDRLRRHGRIAVVADGALLHVPFAALPDPAVPGVPLVANHEVIALPSLSVLERLRRRPAPSRWRGLAAVVADPVFAADDARVSGGGGAAAPPRAAADGLVTRALGGLGRDRFARLPGTRAEAESLLDVLPAGFPVYRAFDFAASREAVLEGALSGYRIVHLATHGVLDRRTPALSGLVLSLVDEEGRPRDGYLPLHEIYGLDLSAEVVVLSACQSGSGREMGGEGLVGLTRGFLEAGVPRLVVSLWQVGDEGSAELMRRFYRAWLERGETPAAALATAQREMWRHPTWSAPYHWAGFQFVGDWQGSLPISRRAGDDPLEPKESGAEPPVPDQDDDMPTTPPPAPPRETPE